MAGPAKKQRRKNSLLRDTVVRSVEITRYAIRRGQPDKDEPVLTTGRNVAFFEAGVANWRFDLKSPDLLAPSPERPPLVAVEATWLTAQQALERGIAVVSGSSANTFGAMGTLLVPPGFHIPTVTATARNVLYYGLQLVESGSDLAVATAHYPIAMMEYDYTAAYKQHFLMKKHGGGGVFLETHDFPHIHIPTSAACGGYIVIGKAVAPGEYHFTAFRIPFGSALYTPSNTIHGDGTLVGTYALTVADPALTTADTVLVYNRETRAMARDVVPDWTPSEKNP